MRSSPSFRICSLFLQGCELFSPPSEGKEALLKVMSRYSARLVLLPTAMLNYYYPNCLETLSPEIRIKYRIGSYTLLERVIIQ